MNNPTKIELSIVVPVFNEKANIPRLYEALEKVLHDMKLSYEIIFVDDGSRDGSNDELEHLCHLNSRNKLISLSRNFGHQVALTAGLDYTQGEAVIMMDADMQHPPEIIPELLRKWKEGYDIVYTIRKNTADVGPFKKWSASIFYRLINLMTKTPIPAGAADFRLMDRVVVNELKKIKEHSRFYRGLVSWIGFRQTFVPYYALARLSGTSSYSLGRMVRFAMDGITSFSSFPLRISTYMGFLVSGVSFIYGLYTVSIGLFSAKAVPGWASLMVIVLFLGGLQLVTLGILGEYVGRIYDQVKGRPIYVIQKKLGEFKESSE